MKKLSILLLFTFFFFTGYAQWTNCYEQGTIDVVGYYFDATDGCYKYCPPSSGNTPPCYTPSPITIPATLPIICDETLFDNQTQDEIKIYYDYNLACGQYTLAGMPPVSELYAITGCLYLTCDGFVPDDQCIFDLGTGNSPVENYILRGGDQKINVAYKLKDQCANNGDNAAGKNSDCECPTLSIEVGGIMYSLAGNSITTGSTVVTAIPLPSGGTLGINIIGGVVHFVILP